MSAADLDRGLRAVERARSVRERESRVGLQQVTALREAHRARVATLHRQLSTSVGDALTPTFVASRSHLVVVGEALDVERNRLADTEALLADAHARWSGDKVRLAAVEHLLERRAQRRRVERERRERAELDDVAAQLWLRQREQSASSRHVPDLHPDTHPQEVSA